MDIIPSVAIPIRKYISLLMTHPTEYFDLLYRPTRVCISYPLLLNRCYLTNRTPISKQQMGEGEHNWERVSEKWEGKVGQGVKIHSIILYKVLKRKSKKRKKEWVRDFDHFYCRSF